MGAEVFAKKPDFRKAPGVYGYPPFLSSLSLRRSRRSARDRKYYEHPTFAPVPANDPSSDHDLFIATRLK
jgi:hypothetical protein